MKRNLLFHSSMPTNPKVSGIMDGEKVFCYCSMNNADIIMAALSPKPVIVKSIEDRKQEFYFKAKSFGYDLEMTIAFLEYWTEKSEGQIKMRFEKEKAFDISKRLARWEKNNQKFNPVADKPIVGRMNETSVKNSFRNLSL